MLFRYFAIVAASLFLLPQISWAQEELPDEEVTVLKNFEATLAESERIEILPELPPLDTSRQRQDYVLPNKHLQVDYLPPKIRPLAMRSDDVGEAYNGYLKFGAGIPTTFYGEGSYHFLANDQFDLGLDVKHHSARFKTIEHQRFMTNQLQGTGTYYFDEGFATSALLGYTQDDVYYYAFNFNEDLKDSVVQAADVLQRYATFDFEANLFNGERNVGDFNYDVGIDFYSLNDNYGSKERGFILDLMGRKWIGDHSLDFLISTDFTNFEDTASQSLNNFYLQPAFTFHGDFLKVKIGANLVSHNDEFTLFPDIEASVNVIGSQLAAFAGWNGSLVKNTMRTLSDYNPYINTRLDLVNSNYQHYYGGIKGDVKVFQYTAHVGVKNINNLVLYVPDENPESVIRDRFSMVLDSALIVNFEGAITITPYEGLQIIGTVNNNVYTLTEQEKAWGLPALTINGAVIYTTLEDKLRLKGELFMENGIPYINEQGQADNLNSLFDVSFGANYMVSENFGVFMDINNLANNKRERWLNYPTYGINALVGINLRF